MEQILSCHSTAVPIPGLWTGTCPVHSPVIWYRGRTERINNLHSFILFIFWNRMMFYFEKLSNSLCYTYLWLTITWSLLYLENTSFHVSHIVCFCCIYPPHLNGQSLKLLSEFKVVRGAKMVRDRCPKILFTDDTVATPVPLSRKTFGFLGNVYCNCAIMLVRISWRQVSGAGVIVVTSQTHRRTSVFSAALMVNPLVVHNVPQQLDCSIKVWKCYCKWQW